MKRETLLYSSPLKLAAFFFLIALLCLLLARDIETFSQPTKTDIAMQHTFVLQFSETSFPQFLLILTQQSLSFLSLSITFSLFFAFLIFIFWVLSINSIAEFVKFTSPTRSTLLFVTNIAIFLILPLNIFYYYVHTKQINPELIPIYANSLLLYSCIIILLLVLFFNVWILVGITREARPRSLFFITPSCSITVGYLTLFDKFLLIINLIVLIIALITANPFVAILSLVFLYILLSIFALLPRSSSKRRSLN